VLIDVLAPARAPRTRASLPSTRLRQIPGASWAEDLRDPDVEQLYLPVAGHENVRRLEIPMDDEVLVRVRHRIAHTPEQIDALVDRVIA